MAGASCAPRSPDPADPAAREPTGGPEPGAERADGEPTALRPAAGLLLGTPVYDGDFADPFVLRVGDSFYAYATNTRDAAVPVVRVHDSPVARYHGDALAGLPAWSEPGFVWAPAVAAVGGGFVLYYSTRVRGTSMQCISSAWSDDPLGPFVDRSEGPMVCQRDRGGTIDPSVVTDASGQRWLLFKNDGNCCGLDTSLWAQQLAPDGRSTQGPAHELLRPGAEWQGGLIEGPSMVGDGDRWFLFYSANAWDSEDYAVGYAVCESVSGPCTDASVEGPWMSSTAFARGPGGQEFFDAVGDVWMVYHGWAEGEAGRTGAQRRLFLDVVELDGAGPERVGRTRSRTVLVVVLAGAAVAVVVAVAVARRRGRAPASVPA